VDPGPADKEYAIPLGPKAGAGAGAGAGKADNDLEEDPERVNIAPSEGPGAVAASDRSTERERKAVTRLATSAGIGGSSLSTSLLVGLIALGLIVLGTGAGLLLRRRSSE
jgi:hypothetical protein